MSRDRQRLGYLIVAVVAAACLIGKGFGQATCPAQGSCLEAHQNPGCENTECCQLVCSADPFCCQSQWDSYCADEGWAWCAASCGGPLAGDCLVEHPDPACDDPACCDQICSADAFCCEQQWDAVCADAAYQACAASCGGSLAGDCLQPHPDPACWDSQCCDVVCSSDPYCCDSEWDQTCASEGFDLCTACGSPSAGSCYASHGPNCSDESCCAAICSLDSYCCLVAWDGYCVDAASALCAPCGAVGAGSCFAPHGPGCDDAECCLTICAVDNFCCTTAWDSTCVATATDICAACGNPASGACLAVHDQPFCDDPPCCYAVCALDDYCCTAAWDDVCVAEAAATCGGCGAPEAPSCLLPHTTSGCDDIECCATVCGQDSFCCELAWDATCVAQALAACSFSACYGLCDGDLDANGTVGPSDLSKLLGAWGTATCADINGDGVVNPADLSVLLGNWGACAP